MPLSGPSVGTYQETSSHLSCQGTLGHSHLSSLSLWTDRGLKRRMNFQTFSQNPCMHGKASSSSKGCEGVSKLKGLEGVSTFKGCEGVSKFKGCKDQDSSQQDHSLSSS